MLATKDLGKINHFYNASMPYAEKWLLVKTHKSRALIDLDKQEIIWSQPVNAKAQNQNWNKNSRSLAFTIENNLYVTTADGQETQVTNEPEGVLCGQSVHRNEFGISVLSFLLFQQSYCSNHLIMIPARTLLPQSQCFQTQFWKYPKCH